MVKFVKQRIKNYLNRFIRDNVSSYYKQENSLESWFYYWLHFQNFGYAKNYCPKNCYYEFGTGWGGTLTSFLNAANRLSNENNFDIHQIKIVLFDSFKGLPDIVMKEDDHPTWQKGLFAYSKDYIQKIITDHGFPLENVTFIEGFFEDTLTNDLFSKLKEMPPSIVTMDVDFYSSTKLALDFIAPMLGSGTVFYFDDLYSFFLHPELGQVKAISEFNSNGIGNLNPLTSQNHDGRCYIYTRKNWEHFSSHTEAGSK